MTIPSKILVVLFAALAISPAMIAQETATQSPAAAVVPEDQQPTDQQLNRLFDVMRIEQQMASTMKMMPQIMQQQFARQMEQMTKDHPEFSKLTPEQQQAWSKMMAKFIQDAMSLYSPDEMIADMKTIYRRHLTGSDVENLITFYSSSSGQHMLDMVPTIMQEYMPMLMSKIQGKMQPLILEMSKEMVEIIQSPAGKPGPGKTDQPK